MTHYSQSAAQDTLRTWLKDWGGIVATIMGIYVFGYALWYIFRWGGEANRTLINDIAVLPLGILSTAFSLRVSMHPALSSRTRWAWRILGLAFLSYLIGNSLLFYYENIKHDLPYPSWADAAYLGFYPLLLGSLFLFPTLWHNRMERITFWLDAGIVCVGGGMLIWYLILAPVALGPHTSFLETVVAFAYPVGDLVGLFGLTSITLRRSQEETRLPLSTLALALLLNTVADTGYSYLFLQHGAYESGSWPDILWLGAHYLMLVSAQQQYWCLARRTSQRIDLAQEEYRFSLLPYLALIIGYGLLLFIFRDSWRTAVGGVIIGAILLSALVVLRQIAATRMAIHARTVADTTRTAAEMAHTLERINADLEQRVAERTATLEQALAAQEAQAAALQESLTVQQQLSQTLAALSVPLIPIRDDVLVIPLIGTIDEQRAQVLLETVLQRVASSHVAWLVVDLTGVAVIDRLVAKALVDTASAVKLLGANMMLVGIRPEVAQALISLGADLSHLYPAATLQDLLTTLPMGARSEHQRLN